VRRHPHDGPFRPDLANCRVQHPCAPPARPGCRSSPILSSRRRTP
jgi:hypothetical protein